MKKLLAICIVLVLTLSLSFSAFAAGAFVSSPSNNKTPELVDYKGDANCSSKPTITGYGDRDKLSPEDVKKIEDAYGEISGAKTPSDLVKDLTGDNLGVSDLFDLSFSDCSGNHDGHGAFDLTLNPDSVNGFEALIRKTDNGWEKVPNARVEGDHLLFTADSDAVYAIVVKTKTSSPQTGDNASTVLYVVAMFACVAGAAFVCKKVSAR